MDSRTWLAQREQFGIKLGLETITSLLRSLDHPERTAPVIHIAGTNGKGSVAATVAHAFGAAGIRAGRYTSPHMIRLEERFGIDGRSIAPADLDVALESVRQLAGSLSEHRPVAVEPTYFEVTTAAAFQAFRTARVDAMVIEVGLGGRFDATNVVNPMVTAITSIDLDHEAQLGSTLPHIAAEKAGIIKPGVPVVVGPMHRDAHAVIVDAARASGSPLVDVADSPVESRMLDDGHCEVVIRTPHARYGPLRLALAGRHQIGNALVAVRLLETARDRGLRIPEAAIIEGLTTTRWPARLERVQTNRGEVLIDGAHNPAGARALASYLQQAHPGGLPVVFGAMADKGLDGMLAALAPEARPLVLTRAPGRRAADPEALAERAQALQPPASAIVIPALDAALEQAWARGPLIVVAGSLYLAGAVLELLGHPVP